MKKIIIYIYVTLLFFQCKSQVQTGQNQIFNIDLNENFEKLDINSPSLLKTKKRYGTTEPEEYKVDLEEIDNQGNSNRTFGTIQSEYNQYLYTYKGWFNIYKEFYGNGYIKRKNTYNKTDINGQYYKEYEFDESGNLVKTTDYDKDYKTSFEQITRIAGKYGKKYGYQAKTGMNDVIEDKLLWNNDYVKIWRKEYKQKKYWLIGFNKPQYKNSDDKKCERLVVVVDDATGKVIKKEHYYDWYNRFLKDIEKLVK